MLIIVCPIIKDLVYVKEEVEIVKADYWLLLRHSAEMILIDKWVEILYITLNISKELFPIIRN